MHHSYQVLLPLPSGHAGKQQRSQLSLFSSPLSPPTSTRRLQKKERQQLKWADVCAQAYEAAGGEVSGTVDLLRPDRTLLSLFSERDLRKRVDRQPAAAGTCTAHTHTHTQGHLVRTLKGYNKHYRDREGTGGLELRVLLGRGSGDIAVSLLVHHFHDWTLI